MNHRRSFFYILGLSLLLASSIVPAIGHSAPTTDPYLDSLIRAALERNLQNDLYWHTLLHYRPRVLGGVKSEVDSPKFFNSLDGRKDPQAELVATLGRFFEPMPEDPVVQHPQCLFIDRYQWLKEQLRFDPSRLLQRPCKDFQEWRTALDPESITLVFSSYYMNNPSSTFGHTLLRLNQSRHSKQERLLDYGVNYAANPTTTNMLLYALLGITGGFPGIFSNVPYFTKVQEYNDTESRDLWEYDLDFTPGQVERMVFHLWSIGHVQVAYYFLDRNCSYMILTLLDAARPELQLAKKFQGWTVIPADTVRAISKVPGLIKKIEVRTAISTRIRRQRSALTPQQDQLFLEIIGNIESDHSSTGIAAVKSLSQNEASALLDLLLDYLRYLKIRGKNILSDRATLFQSELLLARSELPVKTQDFGLSAEEIERTRPDQGHDTSRMSLGSGFNSDQAGYIEAGWRASFHDLNASHIGYPRHAEIEVLSAKLRYSPKTRELGLERFRLVSVTALTPFDRVFKKISWNMAFGVDPVRDIDCRNCAQGGFNVGAGITLDPTKNILVYFLGKMELAASFNYFPRYRFGPIASTGAILGISDRTSLKIGAEYHQPLLGFTAGYYQASAEGRISVSTNTDFRFQYDLFKTQSQAGLVFNVYY